MHLDRPALNTEIVTTEQPDEATAALRYDGIQRPTRSGIPRGVGCFSTGVRDSHRRKPQKCASALRSTPGGGTEGEWAHEQAGEGILTAIPKMSNLPPLVSCVLLPARNFLEKENLPSVLTDIDARYGSDASKLKKPHATIVQWRIAVDNALRNGGEALLAQCREIRIANTETGSN